jgi:DNA-binding CsgD family transcriptional regulator
MAQFMQDEFSGYGYVLVGPNEVATSAMTTFPADWHERYFREDFQKIDPVFEFNRTCKNGSGAKLLNEDEMSSPLFEEAKAAGANSNFVSVSVFAGNRLIFGGVNHDLDDRKVDSLHQSVQATHRRLLIEKIDHLTGGQVDFLDLCEEGLLDKQIAVELGITLSAVAQRKKSICQKVGTQNFRAVVTLYSLRKWSGIVPMI